MEILVPGNIASAFRHLRALEKIFVSRNRLSTSHSYKTIIALLRLRFGNTAVSMVHPDSSFLVVPQIVPVPEDVFNSGSFPRFISTIMTCLH